MNERFNISIEETPYCPNACSYRGDCNVDTLKCSCTDDYYGDDCSLCMFLFLITLLLVLFIYFFIFVKLKLTCMIVSVSCVPLRQNFTFCQSEQLTLRDNYFLNSQCISITSIIIYSITIYINYYYNRNIRRV